MNLMRMLFIVVLALFPLICSAEDGSIMLGGKQLSLGDSESKVMSLFRDGFVLSQSGHMWHISSGQAGHFRLIGSMVFNNGKLSWISRYWGVESSNPEEVYKAGQSLYGAINSVTQGESTLAIIQTSASRVPSGSLEQIKITINEREIVIILGDINGQSSMSIQEDIRSP